MNYFSACSSVLFNLFVIAEPLIYFPVCHGVPLTKLKKQELLVRKSNMSLFDTSTNEQLLQKLKSKKFNNSVVLAFMEFICCIQNLAIRQKEVVSEICAVPFSNFGNCHTFGLGASFTFELHCSLRSTPSLLLLFFNFASSGLSKF